MSEEKPWVVLGAGPAGLAAAYELASNGKKVIVFEEREFVGGASATVYKDGFAYDFGPHVFHIKGTEIDSLFENMAKEKLLKKEINQKLFLESTIISYPLKFYELIKTLHPIKSMRMVFDYFLSNLIYAFYPLEDDNFESWGMKRFGYSLYNLCFGQYTKRIWGVSPHQLSSTLASTKLHKLNLWDILLKLFGFTGQEQATHWTQFYYPEKGIGEIWESMSEKIKELGGKIILNSPVKKIKIKMGKVDSIIVTNTEGKEENYVVDKLISTIPLNILAKMLKGFDTGNISQLGDSLKYVSLVTVNLAFNVEHLQNSHWIYLLDPMFRFNRLSEQKNIGFKCAPKGKTYLSLELTYYDEDDPMQFADDDFLERLALNEIDKIQKVIPQINRKNHCGTEIARLKNAYPMYLTGFEEVLDKIIEKFSKIKNMILVGRNGLFLNSDIHDSMEMGLKAARYYLSNNADNDEWYKMSKEYINFKISRVKN